MTGSNKQEQNEPEYKDAQEIWWREQQNEFYRLGGSSTIGRMLNSMGGDGENSLTALLEIREQLERERR